MTAQSPLEYIAPGTIAFRFLSPASSHFWPALTDILSESKCYLISRNQFNDPYDSRPKIRNDVTDAQVVARAARIMADPWSAYRDSGMVAKILLLKEQGKTRLSTEQIENIKRDTDANSFLDQSGLLSFSLTAENALLWAHYAAGYSGIALVFRRGVSMKSAFCLCAKVMYSDHRPTLSLKLLWDWAGSSAPKEQKDQLADEIAAISFFHKSEAWKYEQEARIFYPFKAHQKLPFESSELIAILLGPRASVELEVQVNTLAKRRAPGLEVHRTRLSDSGYSIDLPSWARG